MSAPLTVQTLPAGIELSGYRLAGLLGKGGMGAVYLAEQLSLGRQVALKVLPQASLNSREKIDRFMTEARIAASLNHPGLVCVHEVGFDQQYQLYFYSMELVHGRTLRTVINQEGALPIDRAVSIVGQVCAAVAHAHRQGLMHRDIKPENVLLTPDYQAKLADLGLATAEARGADQVGPRVLSIVGTPGWSAPEQLRSPGGVTPASDVFAIGCLLSYAITGLDPFTGQTLLDLAMNVATMPVAGLAMVQAPYHNIIAQMTAKEVSQRPPSAGEALIFLGQENTPAASVRRLSSERTGTQELPNSNQLTRNRRRPRRRR